MASPSHYDTFFLKGDRLARHCCERLTEAIQAGQVVLLPTDTGYCFAGDPHSARVHKAFLRLRSAHPKNKPFSLLCPNIAALSEVCHISTPHYRIVKKILPGPYTCIFQRHKKTPASASTQKGKTVGIRVPDSPHLHQILDAVGSPLLTTSATDADQLELENYYEDFHSADSWWAHASEIVARSEGLVAAAVDQSPLPMRASTIFDFTSEPPRMLRDGGWDLSDLTFDYEPV